MVRCWGSSGCSWPCCRRSGSPSLIGFDHPATWIITLVAGLVLGAVLGLIQGAVVAYVGVPSFIVTLGGLLVWRGLSWVMASGRTIAPMDTTFQLLGGGARGTVGGTVSWIIGIVAAASPSSGS